MARRAPSLGRADRVSWWHQPQTYASSRGQSTPEILERQIDAPAVDRRPFARITGWSNALPPPATVGRRNRGGGAGREREVLLADRPARPVSRPECGARGRDRAHAGRAVLRSHRDGHARREGRAHRHGAGGHDQADRRGHGADPGRGHRRRLPPRRYGQRGVRGGGLLHDRVVRRRAGAPAAGRPARAGGTSSSSSSTGTRKPRVRPSPPRRPRRGLVVTRRGASKRRELAKSGQARCRDPGQAGSALPRGVGDGEPDAARLPGNAITRARSLCLVPRAASSADSN